MVAAARMPVPQVPAYMGRLLRYNDFGLLQGQPLMTMPARGVLLRATITTYLAWLASGNVQVCIGTGPGLADILPLTNITPIGPQLRAIFDPTGATPATVDQHFYVTASVAGAPAEIPTAGTTAVIIEYVPQVIQLGTPWPPLGT